MTAAGTHVAVLMGGWSAEREVSLASGEACAAALERLGYRTTRIDAGPDIASRLLEVAPDVVFNALHGRWGEDGCVQGVLEVLAIPYTHSGVLASALAMNKEAAKLVFANAGIPVAESMVVDRAEAAAAHVMPPPYVIKPVAEGSSVGVHIVPDGANAPSLPPDDTVLAEKVMVERFVPGRELTCAVMDDRALDIIDIVPAEGFYDYRAKYAPGGSRHILPAEIPPDVYARIQDYTLKAHRALGCRGVSRSDFRYDEATGELVILETNTQPGMTGTSLVPEMAQYAGYSFEELVDWMVRDASCRR